MTQSRLRDFSLASYLLATAMVCFPLIEFWSAISPFELRSLEWRFGALGVLSGQLTIPAAGAVLGTLTAALCHHRRALTAMIALAIAAAGVLAVLAAALALDAHSMAQLVPDEASSMVGVASGVAVAKLLVYVGISVALAWSGLRVRGSARAVLDRRVGIVSKSVKASADPSR